MMTDKEARAIVQEVWEAASNPRQTPSTAPQLHELQIVQAIGRFEGRYGDWDATNNWGAIQCWKHHKEAEPGHCVLHGDTLLKVQGGKTYVHPYRIYPTPQAGAHDLVRWMTTLHPEVWAALVTADVYLVSLAIHRNGYRGIPFAASDVQQYKGAILQNALEIAIALDEPYDLRYTEPKPGDIPAPKTPGALPSPPGERDVHAPDKVASTGSTMGGLVLIGVAIAVPLMLRRRG